MHLRWCYVICVIGFFLSSTGCSWLRQTSGDPRKHPAMEILPEKAVALIDDGREVDRRRLQQGGNVAIAPFKAGTNVEASAQTDKIALMILKGISETLQENSTSLKVVFPTEKKRADLIVEGHVTSLGKKTRGLKLWRRAVASLAVEGDLVDPRTGKVILHFVHGKTAQQNGCDYRALGLAIGIDIAHFILSESNP